MPAALSKFFPYAIPPVNDVADAASAARDCAVCTVAGILDSTASETVQAVRHRMGPLVEINGRTIAMLFSHYWSFVSREPATPETMQEFQINGIRQYLTERGCTRVQQLGSAASPLTLAEAERRMMDFPEGTWFAFLIIGALGGDAARVTGAHWLAAAKADGALEFLDFQTDIPDHGALFRRRMSTLAHVPAGAMATLGQPSATTGPMRAFGAAPNPAADRAVVIACTPP